MYVFVNYFKAKKNVYSINTLTLELKKKFHVQWSVKKIMLTIFWHMQGPITIDFFEKGTTVNSAFSCQFFRQNSLYLLNDFHICLKLRKDFMITL